MYEKILVPLDGSATGEAALKAVEELVSKLTPTHKVEVTLLSVMSTLTHWVVVGDATAPVPYSDAELEFLEQRVKAYQKKTSEGLKKSGAVVKTRIVKGKAAEQIESTAREIGADLIAMSTHGRSGLSKLAFGSVTEKVLRLGYIPVLIVRAQTKENNA